MRALHIGDAGAPHAVALGGHPRADELHILSCTIGCDKYVTGVVTRVLAGRRRGEAACMQTLLAWGSQLRPLAGADAHSGLKVGRALQLYAEDPAPRGGGPAAARRPYVPLGTYSYAYFSPTWDPSSSAVYMAEGHAVVRLSADDTVTVVAGDVDQQGTADGPGRAARFRHPADHLVSDGTGSLYLAEDIRIRKLQLPLVGAGPGAGAGAPQRVPARAAASDAATGSAAAAAAPGGPTGGAAAAGGEVLVSTLPMEAAGPVWGLAFDARCSSVGSSSGSLLFATHTALYRLPLGDPAAAPLLVAGAEGVRGTAGGRGALARFTSIRGIALDGEGSLYVSDSTNWVRTSVRCVTADGTVTTVVADVEGNWLSLAILPNGCLALSGNSKGRSRLLVLGLGLTRPAGPAPIGPPPRTLPGDLGALLSRQPDSTADVTIVVGGRTFYVHRALLSARCDYFQPRLGDDFADGGEQQLDLPDADPDAFEVVLHFVYTGAADIPAALAQAVAELADRLLMPELCEQATAVVEASASVRSLPRLLLWAEELGPSFAGLLSRLKGWHAANQEEAGPGGHG